MCASESGRRGGCEGSADVDVVPCAGVGEFCLGRGGVSLVVVIERDGRAVLRCAACVQLDLYTWPITWDIVC